MCGLTLLSGDALVLIVTALLAIWLKNLDCITPEGTPEVRADGYWCCRRLEES
jgi:hypothetical protein